MTSPIPEDIKSGLQNLATSSKVEPKVLIEELKQILANDETIKSMPPEQSEFRIRYAWALLCRRHTTTGGVSEMYLRLLSKPHMGKTKAGKPRADVFALIKKITKDEEGNPVAGLIELAGGTVWEKAAEVVNKISKEKVYKVSLSTKDVKITNSEGITLFEGVELGGNDATFIEINGEKFPTNEEFYKEFIEPKEKDLKIDLNEMDMCNRKNRIDIRVIKAMIIDHRTGTKADGSEYGQYVVTDDSMLGGGEKGKPGNYTFWIAPEDVVFERGVTMKFIGAVNYDKANDVVRWDYFFGVPVGTAVKRKVEVKQQPQQKPTESVDVGDLDDVQATQEDEFAV